MELISASTVLKELGHATRLGIYKKLVKAGPQGLPVGDLQKQLEIPASTLIDGFNVAGSNALGQIEIARAQVRQTHGGIRDRQVDDFVEVVSVFIPVVVETSQNNAVLGDAAVEFIRTGADGKIGRAHV